ncbi:helix-turn-helix transcriptional regulator [Niveispirillum sp.]|uniref:helix-turn-helix domain-containing protein n=1 Tax=Niveispirillum sp. TaxID=1917217 RepID=UPI001B4F3430|nr:helix-turn-helix transcriptional regulator [Niveispirillum sp.]MBP7337694.1 helix-turn-helix transcriptional regulator [Niveispirillum sp.]
MENTSMQSGDGKGVAKVRPTAITSDRMQEVFTDAFRVEVGRGKAWSREALAQATGFDTSSIGSWMNGEAVPTAWKLVRLMAVLGPVFTNRVLVLAGQAGADWVLATTVSILDVNAACSALAAQVAADMADGQIDDAEEAALAVRLQQVVDLGGDYLATRHRRTRVSLSARFRVVGG